MKKFLIPTGIATGMLIIVPVLAQINYSDTGSSIDATGTVSTGSSAFSSVMSASPSGTPTGGSVNSPNSVPAGGTTSTPRTPGLPDTGGGGMHLAL
ncbi:MAG: hypothetical protein PHZ00_06895 [Candidatus Peribacteraceae bacterium]|nr:hypothetical protein [Candidatus Peribacteraceae bacterium]